MGWDMLRVAILMSWFAASLAVAGPATAPLPSLVERGEASIEVMNRYLGPQRGKGYMLQEVKPDDPRFRAGPAYNWAMGIVLSAYNAGAAVDPGRYSKAADDCVKFVDAYWTTANGISGYAADFRPSSNPQRYYDDNAWIVLGLLEAYDRTRDPSQLRRTREAAKFVFSGEDGALGGGLYWRESERKSKNTCSNAPGMVGALRLYQVTGESGYMDVAKRLYAWTNKTLQDPADGLFFDHLTLTNQLDRTKWSYNSALMIRANCLLFDVTKEKRYLDEARRIGTAAAERWFKADGRMSDHSYFAHLLAEALLELSARDHDPRWAAIVRRTADFVWRSNRDSRGVHPERWDAVAEGNVEKIMLMPQASAARLFFRLAMFDRDRAGIR